MMALWNIRLLGGLQVEGADRVITRFRTQKTAALLAYLAYYRDRPHPRTGVPMAARAVLDKERPSARRIAGEAGHLQIRENQVVMALANSAQRVGSVGAGIYQVAIMLQDRLNGGQHIRLIVHYEDTDGRVCLSHRHRRERRELLLKCLDAKSA